MSNFAFMITTDERTRCQWCVGNPLDREYHDSEWGDIRHDDREHYRNLLMEVMQCGLSWNTILRKRDVLRQCFADFDYNKVARFDDDDVRRILSTEGMIKSERKVRAIILDTKVFLDIRKEFGSFDKYIWSFTDGQILRFRDNLNVTQCEASRALSKDLKSRGCKYLGPVVLHSHMQAMGLIFAHEPQCWKYKKFMSEGHTNVKYIE